MLAGAAPEELPRPPFAVDEEAAPNLRLLGYERGSFEASAGEPWGMALWWLASAPLEPYTISLDLVAESGTEHTLLESRPAYGSYPFEQWETPQFVIDRQVMAIPADFPAGEYRLRMRLAGASGEAIYTADLGPMLIEAAERTFSPPPFANEVNARFGEEIALLGYDLSPAANGRSDLTLVWRALQEPTAEYTVFVHLLHPDGTCCAWQQDSAPQSGAYATSRWLPGEVVVDNYQIALPADLPSGAYPIELGLYLAETGQRLPVEGAGGDRADALSLPPLQVP
jgi:hypothetical protein